MLPPAELKRERYRHRLLYSGCLSVPCQPGNSGLGVSTDWELRSRLSPPWEAGEQKEPVSDVQLIRPHSRAISRMAFYKTINSGCSRHTESLPSDLLWSDFVTCPSTSR